MIWFTCRGWLRSTSRCFLISTKSLWLRTAARSISKFVSNNTPQFIAKAVSAIFDCNCYSQMVLSQKYAPLIYTNDLGLIIFVFTFRIFPYFFLLILWEIKNNWIRVFSRNRYWFLFTTIFWESNFQFNCHQLELLPVNCMRK